MIGICHFCVLLAGLQGCNHLLLLVGMRILIGFFIIIPPNFAGLSGLVLENEGDLGGFLLPCNGDAEERAGDEKDGGRKLHGVSSEWTMCCLQWIKKYVPLDQFFL
jgi:hypothetical protein